MSKFSVDCLVIDTLEHHPNADRLDLVAVGGYRSIVGRDEYQVGDSIFYLPVDAVIPAELSTFLGIGTYLGGKNKDRVRAIKLRGVLSEGIVIPYAKARAWLGDVGIELAETGIYTSWAEALNITKYEEPIPIHLSGKVRHKPQSFIFYDVENIKRPENVNIFSDDELVVIREKAHGSCSSLISDLRESGLVVCSHGQALIEDDENFFWRIVRLHHLDEAIFAIHDTHYPEAQSIILFFESVPTQDLKYGFTAATPYYFLFDIFVDGTPLDYLRFKALVEQYHLSAVPELYVGPFKDSNYLELAEQPSALDGGIREGVVIKPLQERQHALLGRVQLKCISDNYLTRKGKTTEGH